MRANSGATEIVGTVDAVIRAGRVVVLGRISALAALCLADAFLAAVGGGRADHRVCALTKAALAGVSAGTLIAIVAKAVIAQGRVDADGGDAVVLAALVLIVAVGSVGAIDAVGIGLVAQPVAIIVDAIAAAGIASGAFGVRVFLVHIQTAAVLPAGIEGAGIVIEAVTVLATG